MKHIAIAGFQHETNCFNPIKTELDHFLVADSWPPFLRGSDVIKHTKGINLPIAGFVKSAETVKTLKLEPLLWCAAEPGGLVTKSAFETIAEDIINQLKNLHKLDGLYLDLHGAMVCEDIPDGEFEMVRRIRLLTGPDLPLVVSLDLHANISQRFVNLCDGITIYRTYPHLDMDHAGTRAFEMLKVLLAGTRLFRSFRQIPLLVPLPSQYTNASPAKELYSAIETNQSSGVFSCDLAMGFTAADFPDTGPSVIAYAENKSLAEKATYTIYQQFLESAPLFDASLRTPSNAVKEALSLNGEKPVILADVQDNPGAGGSSDTTGILRALIDSGAEHVYLGLMNDPVAAEMAHRAGKGAMIYLELGGKVKVCGDQPFAGQFEVLELNDGQVLCTGEMYRGNIGNLGPSALLGVVGRNIKIVVSSFRNQCLDLAQFRHFSIEPQNAKIIVVKSTVHFRADFEPISQAIINVAAPGLFPCNLHSLFYRNLRVGMQIL